MEKMCKKCLKLLQKELKDLKKQRRGNSKDQWENGYDACLEALGLED